MPEIKSYPKVQDLTDDNVFLMEGDTGTKGILAKDLAKGLPKLMTTEEIIGNIALSDLDAVGSVKSSDMLLVGTADGNKKSTLSNGVYGMAAAAIPLEARRNIWRGKNLGGVVTDAQYAEIKAGTFRDLFLGDFWTIGGRDWRIVDFDYWWGCGDEPCKLHHLVIMPDGQLYTANMNDTNVTTGGYVGSKMYQENLAEAKTIINGAFGQNHILNHREYLTNAVTNGYPSAGAWYDSTVELPNEIMMYGSYIYTPAGNGSFVPNRYTIDKTQLAGMKAKPLLLNPKRQTQWLRDVVSGSYFAYVNGNGNASCYYASYVRGVRPVFGIMGG